MLLWVRAPLAWRPLADIAAKRGHNVVLVDKQEEPGGQLRIASVPPAKQELTRVIKYQFGRLAEAGVDVRMGVELTAEDIQRDFAGYEVVLSYGAEPIVPGFMTGFKQVMTADDLLAGRAFPAKKIVIVGGGSVGCETADYLAPLVNDLAPSNRDVTLIEMTKTLAANEGGAGRAVLVTRILDKGVHVFTEAKLTSVTEDTIAYEKDGEEHDRGCRHPRCSRWATARTRSSPTCSPRPVSPAMWWETPSSAATCATRSGPLTRSPASCRPAEHALDMCRRPRVVALRGRWGGVNAPSNKAGRPGCRAPRRHEVA